MQFIEWLIKQNDKDTIINDIATDVRKDILSGWRGKTYKGLQNRMIKLNGSDLAIEAAAKAYNKYKEYNHV